MRSQRQQGFALLAVLIFSGLCMLLIGQISYRHQLEKNTNSRALIQDQTILLALSAESWARRLLTDDIADNSVDSLQDDWAQALPVLPVEGGYLTGCIQDLQGRFNLNNLQVYNPDRWNDDLSSLFSSDLEAYLSLLAILKLNSDEVRAAVIIDWTDADSDLILPGSAEDADYSRQIPARLASNQAMVSIDELAGLPGYDNTDLRVLYPYITALPGTTGINVNTASAEVLGAMSSVMDRYMVESIIDERPFETLDEFYEFVGETTGYMTQTELRAQLPPEMLSLSSEYFELLVKVNLVNQQLNMRSLIKRNGSQSAVYLREFQTVPVVLSQAQQGIVSTFDCIDLTADQDES